MPNYVGLYKISFKPKQPSNRIQRCRLDRENMVEISQVITSTMCHHRPTTASPFSKISQGLIMKAGLALNGDTVPPVILCWLDLMDETRLLLDKYNCIHLLAFNTIHVQHITGFFKQLKGKSTSACLTEDRNLFSTSYCFTNQNRWAQHTWKPLARKRNTPVCLAQTFIGKHLSSTTQQLRTQPAGEGQCNLHRRFSSFETLTLMKRINERIVNGTMS